MYFLSKTTLWILIVLTLLLCMSAVFIQPISVTCHKFQGELVVMERDHATIDLVNLESQGTSVMFRSDQGIEWLEMEPKARVSRRIPMWGSVDASTRTSFFSVRREPKFLNEEFVAALVFLLSSLTSVLLYMTNIFRTFVLEAHQLYVDYADSLVKVENLTKIRNPVPSDEYDLAGAIDRNRAVKKSLMEVADRHLVKSQAVAIILKIEGMVDKLSNMTKSQLYDEVAGIIATRTGMRHTLF